ncbi:MAG: TRL-like family protein [Candidatus Omnitrophota bacterium]
MRKVCILLVMVFSASVLLTGCASVLPTGLIYTEVKAPVAAGDSGPYSKVGVSKATSILGLVATGDASIKAAMANGKISKIKYVDYDAKNILGIYGEYTTTVYGD